MNRFLRFVPFPTRADRLGRLVLCSLAAGSLTLLGLWNPVENPGPRCCTMRLAFGLPCPLCGMTRGVALCMRGRFWDATIFNLLAVPTFLLCVGLCAKWGLECAVGRAVVVHPSGPWRITLYILLCIALLAGWIYLLAYRREDDFGQTWLGESLRVLGW
jgi:hypothetical protein